jgi:hypothetical protein
MRTTLFSFLLLAATGCSTSTGNVISGGDAGGSVPPGPVVARDAGAGHEDPATDAGERDSGTVADASTDVDGGGGACGGIAGLRCRDGWYCDDNECGIADRLGTCKPILNVACPADCPGVCGCDGKTYCNECTAHVSGVSVRLTQPCSAR